MSYQGLGAMLEGIASQLDLSPTERAELDTAIWHEVWGPGRPKWGLSLRPIDIGGHPLVIHVNRVTATAYVQVLRHSADTLLGV